MEKSIKVNGVEFKVNEIAPMKTCGYLEFINSKDLCMRITSFFKDIFKDYKGTSLKLVNGKVVPVLWFSMASTTGRGPVSAMIENQYSNSDKERWSSTFTRMNNVITGKNRPFTISKEAKDILVTFTNGKPDWNQLVSFREERPQQSFYSMNQNKETLMKVSGLDLNAMLLVIHGDKKEVEFDNKKQEHYLCYDVTFVQNLRPEVPQQFNAYGAIGVRQDDDCVREEMLLKITSIDRNALDEVAASMGAYPDSGNVTMY